MVVHIVVLAIKILIVNNLIEASIIFDDLVDEFHFLNALGERLDQIIISGGHIRLSVQLKNK